MSKQEDARDAVLDLIESLSVGQAIPSERQLTHELGVSRLTVRAALDELVRDGYLDRRDGWYLATMGRLKPGWTAEQADAHLRAISADMLAARHCT